MEKQKLRDLLLRYAKGDCTEAERKVLEDMILRRPLTGDWDWDSEEKKALMGKVIKQRVDNARRSEKRFPFIKRWHMGIAASLLLLAGIALFVQKDEAKITKKLVINETAQSTDGVTLTLADGTVVKLNGHANGVIRNGKGVAIKKLGEGQLVYEEARSATKKSAGTKGEMPMNTIHIPNGKQFRLSLPDGTKVWLNTASTLTYPVVFGDKGRDVTLQGEAYFEVAHDKNRPFSVLAQDTKIAVTGTHFNVSAYSTDKTVTTTLLQGGVDVLKNGSLFKLLPGYQAITYREHDGIMHHKANMENVLAWRNGYFVFDGQDIVSVMRSVARWYDIQVVFDEDIPQAKFGGTFPISAELDDLLADVGTLANISFARAGREVRIMR